MLNGFSKPWGFSIILSLRHVSSPAMARVVRESVKIAVSCEDISEKTVQILYSRLRQRFGSERISLEHVDTARDGEGGRN